MNERGPGYAAGEPITIEPGSAEWHMLVSLRSARDDGVRGQESSSAAADALSRLCELLGPSLPNALRMPWHREDADRRFDREELIAGLKWLSSAGVAPDLLGQLLMALEELDRGMVLDSLKPAKGGARGGKTPFDELALKAAIVQAADELQKEYPKRESWDQALKDLGFSRRTIDGYREQVASGPSEFRDPLSYFLRFGETPPSEVMRLVKSEMDARRA